MTTTAARPEKYIARAYDAGLGAFKRYIVEATDEEDARRILATSGLGDAQVEPYRAFSRRRRRRAQLIVGSIALVCALAVGVIIWQPWRTSSSKPAKSSYRTAVQQATPSATSEGSSTGSDSLAPSFNELSDRYNLDDGRLHLTPPVDNRK